MRQADVSPACSRTTRKRARRQTNLCDEVNSDNRRVSAINIGVLSPSVARDYELDANVGNVVKVCTRKTRD